jgi:hypothetical protein
MIARVSIRAAAALVAGAGVLAVPAGAAAAPVLSAPKTCLVSGQKLEVAGAGFSPGVAVALSGDVTTTAIADELGSFRTTVTAPRSRGLAPRSFSIAAAEVADASIAAQPVAITVVGELLNGNYRAAISGPPRQRTTWRFAGFTAGRPIFGHFRHRGRTVRTYRFGVARGVCGTLTVKAPRVPVKRLRSGVWWLQMDQARRFRKTTQPRRAIKFSIEVVRR